MNHKTVVPLLALMIATPALSQAQVFSENFGNLAPGTAITTGNSGFTLVRELGAPSAVAAAAATIGSGGSLRIVSTISNTPGNYVGVGVDGLPASKVFTLSFDIKSANWLTNHGLIIGLGDGSGGSQVYSADGNITESSSLSDIYNNSLFAVRLFGNSNAGSYPASASLQTITGASAWNTNSGNAIANGAAVSFHFVINGGDSALAVGDITVNAGTFAVWRDGEYWTSYALTASGVTATSLRIFAQGRGGVYTTSLDVEIDNLALWSSAVAPGAAIPEPSSSAAMLGGLVVAGALLRRRAR